MNSFQKRFGFWLALVLLTALAAQAEMLTGAVVYVDSNVVVVATEGGYTVAELYGGYSSLNERDIVVGELHSYGFKDIYCPATRRQARVYIDNYWLSAERAAEWVSKKK